MFKFKGVIKLQLVLYDDAVCKSLIMEYICFFNLSYLNTLHRPSYIPSPYSNHAMGKRVSEFYKVVKEQKQSDLESPQFHL